MAAYKVPQDVEAEDKLIGWLSFRQFVYLGIAVGAAALAFFLAQVSFFLVVIPLPIILLFGTLALPIRKDQPLETYMLAVARFYLKPKLRRWDPDGTISYVEITAPKLVEQRLSKEYGGETAKERLDYLARIMDSRGWSYKTATVTNESVKTAVATEATNAVDVMDENAALSRSFQGLIAKKAEENRRTAMESMRKQPTTSKASEPQPHLDYNPYPSSMHQKVILPPGVKPQTAPAATTIPAPKSKAPIKPAVSPGIIRLANSNNLSISAIANEAHRLQTKEGSEVVIKLH